MKNLTDLHKAATIAGVDLTDPKPIATIRDKVTAARELRTAPPRPSLADQMADTAPSGWPKLVEQDIKDTAIATRNRLASTEVGAILAKQLDRGIREHFDGYLSQFGDALDRAEHNLTESAHALTSADLDAGTAVANGRGDQLTRYEQALKVLRTYGLAVCTVLGQTQNTRLLLPHILVVPPALDPERHLPFGYDMIVRRLTNANDLARLQAARQTMSELDAPNTQRETFHRVAVDTDYTVQAARSLDNIRSNVEAWARIIRIESVEDGRVDRYALASMTTI